MKVLALFLAVISAASAQTEPWCRCAAFVTYQHTEVMVFEAPEVPIKNCNDAGALQCKESCTAELEANSYEGDLFHLTDSGVTVGQEICSELAAHWCYFLHNHMVFGYYEVCGGAWQYAGIASQQKLCCDGGKHVHCMM